MLLISELPACTAAQLQLQTLFSHFLDLFMLLSLFLSSLVAICYVELKAYVFTKKHRNHNVGFMISKIQYISKKLLIKKCQQSDLYSLLIPFFWKPMWSIIMKRNLTCLLRLPVHQQNQSLDVRHLSSGLLYGPKKLTQGSCTLTFDSVNN